MMDYGEVADVTRYISFQKYLDEKKGHQRNPDKGRHEHRQADGKKAQHVSGFSKIAALPRSSIRQLQHRDQSR